MSEPSAQASFFWGWLVLAWDFVAAVNKGFFKVIRESETGHSVPWPALSLTMNFFLRARIMVLTVLVFPVATIAQVVINEVHYDADPKTEFVEFVELHNIGDAPVDLSNWRFSDGISLAVASGTTIAAGGYLIAAEDVSALKGKFPTTLNEIPILEYSGSLSNDGETLELRNATGAVVDEVTYRSGFPWPISPNGEGASMQLINPDLDNDLGGAWRGAAPTPGMVNGIFAQNAPPLIRQVSHSPEVPKSDEATTILAKITDSTGLSSVVLVYQVVNPGSFVPAFDPNSIGTVRNNPNAPLPPNPAFEDPANWTRVAMIDDGSGSNTYEATIPSQGHRTLVRYRIEAIDAMAEEVRVPYADDPSLNFAFFVFDGVPDYRAGSATFSSDVLTTLPVYTMITRDADRKVAFAYSATGDSGSQIPKGNAGRQVYNWECALVYDGVVYDHVGWRLRQNNDRYAGNGKRSMRFRMNRGHYFQAHDENGDKLAVKWRRFNTSKMSRFGGTNSYGLHETINSKLWRMVGVECPLFLPAHFRMIDGAEEAPDQYGGDFFGLATIVQDIDGRLLDDRNLPNGNVYKLKDGVSNPLDLQRNQARGAVTDGSDFLNIKNNLNSGQSEAWLSEHVDWDQWSRYHAVVEAVRHYDFGTPSSHFKNRAWSFSEAPETPFGLLRVIPHDHDASWLKGYHDSLNNVGNSIGTGFPWAAIFDDIRRPPSGTEKDSFTRDYRNFLREFRQLLWQEETVNTIIDDHVTLIEEFTLADRARWTGGPALEGRESMTAIANVASPMRSLAFVSDTMNGSNLSGGRGAYLDQLAIDGAIPNQPVISYTGAGGFPVGQLQFTSSAFSDPQGAGTAGAIEWRIAEVSNLMQGGGAESLVSSGEIWKYFDLGTDPGTGWEQAGFDDSGWGEGESQLGYGEADQVTTVQRGNIATYFRQEFNVSDVSLFRAYPAGVIRDDGAIVYVNGVEVWRNQMPEGAVTFETLASASASGSNERDFQPFNIPKNFLHSGVNVIAVEVHQTSALGGDMSFDFQLQAEPVVPARSFEWDTAWESGKLTDFELTSTPPASATRVGCHYRARVRHEDDTGRWSEWSEPLEFTATAPNTGDLIDALVISEVMYHPADPSSAEIAAGFLDDSDFEFIEIFNAGEMTLSLENVRFTKGIDFDFSGTLEAGAYLLVVSNREAFEFRYGAGFPIAGEWSGSLSNGGERLKLSFGAGEPLSDFEYNDQAPWVTSADGGGKSLTRIFSGSGSQIDDPFTWRASVVAGGSPGGSDAVPFSGDANMDLDRDGLTSLLEHFHGTDDSVIDVASDLFSIIGASEGLVTFAMQRSLAGDDLAWEIESSPDLAVWTPVGTTLSPLSNTDNGNGTSALEFLVPSPSSQTRFWRLKVRKD